MADWSKPTLSSLYTDFLTEVKNRDDDIAKQFDGTTSTNLVSGYIRWDSTANRWKKWNGSIWAELATTYALTGLSLTGDFAIATNKFTVASASGNTVVGGTLTVTGASGHTGAATFSDATSPIISAKIGTSAAIQHTIPAVTSDTIALLAATQTLTNKTYSGGTLSGTVAGSPTLSGVVTFSNATSPIVVAKIGANTTQQHALPAVTSDTIALLAATQTFTNKTFTSPAINTATIAGGTINNAAIGGTTPLTGAFTTLSATGDISFTGTGRLKVPTGTTAERPGTPAAGWLRFNSTLNQFEGHNGSAWGAIGAGATGGTGNAVFYENEQTVTVDYTITTAKNAMSAGEITINSGVTVTVPSGSNWVIV